MLDDAAFAQAWVESRDRSRPRGERAIRVELGQKGLDKTVIDEVLAHRRVGRAGDEEPDASGADETPLVSADRAAADRLMAKHARSLARVADPRQRRARAYSLLARNGFDPETCRVVAAGVAVPVPDEFEGEDAPE